MRYLQKFLRLSRTLAKYEIGRYIVEDEQQGKYRAQYGKAVLKNLSNRLTERFGNGWSLETLKKYRFFYNAYSTSQIESTALTQLAEPEKGLHRGPNSTLRLNGYSSPFPKTPIFMPPNIRCICRTRPCYKTN